MEINSTETIKERDMLARHGTFEAAFFKVFFLLILTFIIAGPNVSWRI